MNQTPERLESYWDYSKQIQPLVAGTYSLEVRSFDISIYSLDYGTLQDTYTVDFTVIPEPASILLLAIGFAFIRQKYRVDNTLILGTPYVISLC